VKYILKTFNIGDKMKHKLTQSAIEEINKKKVLKEEAGE